MVDIDKLDVKREGEFFIHAYNKPGKKFLATLLEACKIALSTGDQDVVLMEANPPQGDGIFETEDIEEILDKHAGGWRPEKSRRRADEPFY